METIAVRDLMVSIEEYPRISGEDTVFDAISAMELARQTLNLRMYKPRRIFVVDSENRVVGRISQISFLKGFEPKTTSETGLWQRTLDDICEKAFEIKVKDIMEVPTEEEFIDEKESLDMAINQLIKGGYPSLIVMRAGEAVGVLRLSDVFDFMCIRIKACGGKNANAPKSGDI